MDKGQQKQTHFKETEELSVANIERNGCIRQ